MLYFEFEKSVVRLHSRDKLKATSTIYTLVKLRSVEPSPSFQDMAVISWTPSSWSLCFTKAQRRTVEVVSVKLPRNGNMEVSYIYKYIHSVYIYIAQLFTHNTWIVVARKTSSAPNEKSKRFEKPFSWQNLLHFSSKRVVSHMQKSNWKQLAVKNRSAPF